MRQKVVVEKINICDCENEATLTIKAYDRVVNAYAMISAEFAHKIPLNTEIEVDLWLVYCFVELSSNIRKYMKFGANSMQINGCVTEKYENDYIQVDCGIRVDVDCEKDISPNVELGSYVLTKGTIRVYFPNSEYEFGELT